MIYIENGCRKGSLAFWPGISAEEMWDYIFKMFDPFYSGINLN